MSRRRDHRPRMDTSPCPDPEGCVRLYHGSTDLFVGDICECCGQEVAVPFQAMTEAEFSAAPARDWARTERMNLVFLHECGKAVGYPTTRPLQAGGIAPGLSCDGCGKEDDVHWRALRWTDRELITAPGVPPLMKPASTPGEGDER